MNHLIVIALGPVQDFIVRARRTRDLWFGSFLLSEMSKAAAKELQNCGYKLIFPHASAPSQLEDLLKPCTESATLTQAPSISNVVLAMSDKDACAPESAAQSARDAADACWRYWAKQAHQACETLLRSNSNWEQQINDALEFYAVWVPLEASEADYHCQHQRLMQLLAGRKLMRDFQASSDKTGCLPKSSLDGSRETVLKDADTVAGLLLDAKQFALASDSDVLIGADLLLLDAKQFALAYRLRLRRNEQLSAIDLVKRAATKEAFPSVTRVALDPWIRGVGKDNLKAIATLCKELLGHGEDKDQAAGHGLRYREIYGDFPYDGQLLLKDRVAAAIRQAKAKTEAKTEADAKQESGEAAALRQTQQDGGELVTYKLDVLQKIQAELPKLYKDYDPPDPYLAVLVADGDGMGEILRHCQNPPQHQALSSALSDFSVAARTAIRERFHGVCVFAGGEDVLALLPVDKALCCAEYLRSSYSTHLAGTVACGATLSVGVAVGHCLESLEDLRAWAQEAEQAAKNKSDVYPSGAGNALAIHYYPRGGVPRTLRGHWEKKEKQNENEKAEDDLNLCQRLHRWAEWLDKGWLPNKAAYDLETLARQYMRVGSTKLAWGDDRVISARAAIVAEACRLFACKGLDDKERDKMRQQFKNTLEAAMDEEPDQPQRAALHLAQEWQFAELLMLKQCEARGEKIKRDKQP